MPWDKLGMTMAGLLLVTAALRVGGRRLAGLVAGLPTVTAPTLAWTAAERGTDFAVLAAIGSVASCAAGALFALAYVRASRTLAATGALGCGLVATALAAVPALQVSQDLAAALALALGVTGAAWLGWPTSLATEGTPPVRRKAASGQPLRLALIAALLTAAVSTIGPWFGPVATGLLASLPLVTAPLAMAEHAGAGPHAAADFLRGYVRGLFGKAAFGVAFVLLAPLLGAGPALGLAVAIAGLMSLQPAAWRRTSAA